MLVNGSRFTGTAVLSLHVGGKIGSLEKPVINPANLRILAYKINSTSSAQETFLLTTDIREIGSLGAIIDNTDELVLRGDVLRLDELLKTNFTLLGMRVKDTDGHKLGKVNDYTLDISRFEIQQLSIHPGILKSITDTNRLVHRSQIVDIDNQYITVKSAKTAVSAPVLEQSRSAFVNPFRATPQSPQVESTSVTSP